MRALWTADLTSALRTKINLSGRSSLQVCSAFQRQVTKLDSIRQSIIKTLSKLKLGEKSFIKRIKSLAVLLKLTLNPPKNLYHFSLASCLWEVKHGLMSFLTQDLIGLLYQELIAKTVHREAINHPKVGNKIYLLRCKEILDQYGSRELFGKIKYVLLKTQPVV